MPILAKAEIDIQAPVEEVWSVMVDFRSCGNWNPFIIAIHDAPMLAQVGDTMTLEVRWVDGGGGGTKSGEKITVLQAPDADRPGQLAYRFQSWLDTLGLVRAERVQRIESLGPDLTRYTTEEVFGGLLASVVPVDRVQAGFTAHAEALKLTCER